MQQNNMKLVKQEIGNELLVLTISIITCLFDY